jgi:hypothetical protein
MPDDEVQRIAESRLGRVLRGKYRLDEARELREGQGRSA